jgi:hypothetical protein
MHARYIFDADRHEEYLEIMPMRQGFGDRRRNHLNDGGNASHKPVPVSDRRGAWLAALMPR